MYCSTFQWRTSWYPPPLCVCVDAVYRIVTSWHPWSWQSDLEKRWSSKRWMELNLYCIHCWGGTSSHRVRTHTNTNIAIRFCSPKPVCCLPAAYLCQGATVLHFIFILYSEKTCPQHIGYLVSKHSAMSTLSSVKTLRILPVFKCHSETKKSSNYLLITNSIIYTSIVITPLESLLEFLPLYIEGPCRCCTCSTNTYHSSYFYMKK